MKTDKNICVVVKAPWFIRGEHRHTVVMDGDFVSQVQVGDMAHLYTVEGEHLVLECVRIRKGLGWFEKPQGDVISVNQKWVYRFTRL